MPDAPKLTTTLSAEGQVSLPASILRRRRWNAGIRLTVEETADGVLLKSSPIFPPTEPEKVFGSLYYRKTAKTLDEMQVGIANEARRRHSHDE